MQIFQRFLVGNSKHKSAPRDTLARRCRIVLATALTIAAGNASGTAESPVPEGLSAADWTAIKEVHDQAKYRPVPALDDGWIVNNPRQGFKAHFAADGSTTLESTEPARPFLISMRLSSVGYDEATELKAPPQQMSEYDAGVRIAWTESLREWWINSPDGLEQWFELSKPPASENLDQPLRLRFSLNTSLEPSIENNTLILASKEQDLNIRYARLKVWDATGRILPAWMVLDDGGFSLNVEDEGAVYPVTIDPTFEQVHYVKASNTGFDDSFGWSVAVSGDTVVVGAPGEASDATGVDGDQTNNAAINAGAAYVFVRNMTGQWSQQAYIKASNAETPDSFGWSVAISGETLVVGAPSERSNARGINGDQADNSAQSAGAAYVFERDGNRWVQRAYLKASNADGGDQFGWSVAISTDTIAIGALTEDSGATGVDGNQDNNDAPGAGAAYVFVRQGSGEWLQQAYLKASNTDGGDIFGNSVAISDDSLVVGARLEDSNATGVDGNQNNNDATDSGAAYVFARDGTTWSQESYLKASNTDALDWFGSSVSVSEGAVLIGARREDSGASGVDANQADNSAPDAGAAYAFSNDGSGWSQQDYLKASNTSPGDEFGTSVSILDGNAVIGAFGEGSDGSSSENQLATASGAAYVFLRDAGGFWVEEGFLKASNTGTEDIFGIAVAIGEDLIIVGASEEDSSATGLNLDQLSNSETGAGAAYIYSNNTEDFPEDTIDPSDGTYSVIGSRPLVDAGLGLAAMGDVDGDGRSEVLVGAPGDGDSGEGAVYLIGGTEERTGSDSLSAIPLSIPAPQELSGLRFGPLDTDPGGAFGQSVIGDFDFDGDGVMDIAIGHPGINFAGVEGAGFSGAVQWIGGAGLNVPRPLEIAPPIDRFLLLGRSSERIGQRLAVGDFNGDGLDDLAIQGLDDQSGLNGSVFLVFGNSDGTGDLVSDDLPGPAGIAFRGETFSAGYSLNGGIGLIDLNNDGCDDLVMGGERPVDETIRDSVFVVYGQSSSCAPVLENGVGPSGSIASFPFDGTSGVLINRIAQDTGFGSSVSAIGDFNGDGLADLAIGEPHGPTDVRGLAFSSLPRTGPGAIHVIYGWQDLSSEQLTVESLPDGRGISIFGWMPSSLFGVSIAGAGDVIGDEADDLIVGSSRDLGFCFEPPDPGILFRCPIGRVYMIPGGAGYGPQVALSDLLSSGVAETFGFGSLGATEFGWRVSGGVDFDGDEFPDLIVSAPNTPIAGSSSIDDTRAGQAWVVPGSAIRAEQLEIESFEVSPSSIQQGGLVSIGWNVMPQEGTNCEASGLTGTAWDGSVGSSGAVEIDTSGLSPGQFEVTLTCTLNQTSVSETRELQVLIPPTELDIQATPVQTGVADRRFVTLQVSNIGEETAVDVLLDALAPESYEIIAGYRLAPSCDIEPSGSGEVRCNVDGIPEWQCSATTDLVCTLEQLPANGSASVVVELQGSGTSALTGSVTAENAAEVSTQLEISD